MRLARNVEQALSVVTIVSVAITLAVIVGTTVKSVFAEDNNTEDSALVEGAKFVTFYDEGEKLTVKTDAPTVADAIERAGIILNEGDVIEPAEETRIDRDNFYINIHRARPVVVKDGKKVRYLMTASQNIREIAEQAGLTFFDGDEVEIDENRGFLETGVATVYKIVRNGGREVTIEEEIEPGERVVKDYNLTPGQKEVREIGEVGVRKVTYDVTYEENEEVRREKIAEEVVREPKERVVAVGANRIEMSPLTASKGTQRYTYTKSDGTTVLRKETYYDLDMHVVMGFCGGGHSYSVRDDGVKVDEAGYVIVAANHNYYPRCSIVETSLGEGKVYDTGGFASTPDGPEWFDIATDWTNHNGV